MCVGTLNHSRTSAVLFLESVLSWDCAAIKHVVYNPITTSKLSPSKYRLQKGKVCCLHVIFILQIYVSIVFIYFFACRSETHAFSLFMFGEVTTEGKPRTRLHMALPVCGFNFSFDTYI